MHKESKLSPTLALAALPFFGYLSAFCYETIYLSYFGIPKEFVYVDIQMVFVALLGIIIVLLSSYWFFYFAAIILNPIIDLSKGIWRRLAIFNYLLLLFFGFLYWNSVITWVGVLYCLVGLATFNIIYFFMPVWILPNSKKKCLGDRIEEFLRGEPNILIYQKLSSLCWGIPTKLLTFAVCVVVLAGIAGIINASRTRSFIFVEGQDKIIVRSYTNIVILKKYNRSKDTIQRPFYVWPTDKLGDFKLKKIQIKNAVLNEKKGV